MSGVSFVDGLEMKLVSIIVPAYNAEGTLERCVRSALMQTYSALEIILVDDGSTDGTYGIAVALSNEDSRVIVVHQSNAGLSGARNAGLEMAKGGSVFFLDSDDCLDSREIETLVSEMRKEDADVAVGGLTYVLPDGSEGEVIEAERCVVDERGFWDRAYTRRPNVYVECVVSWGKLFKRSLFNKERFDHGKIHEDEFIIHRIISQCAKVVFVETSGYYYIQNDKSITHNIGAQSRTDAAEAFLLRANYFRERGWSDLAWAALYGSSTFLSQSSDYIESKADRERLALLLERWRIIFKKLEWLGRGSLKYRAACLFFSLCPKLCAAAHRRKNTVH